MTAPKKSATVVGRRLRRYLGALLAVGFGAAWWSFVPPVAAAEPAVTVAPRRVVAVATPTRPKVVEPVRPTIAHVTPKQPQKPPPPKRPRVRRPPRVVEPPPVVDTPIPVRDTPPVVIEPPPVVETPPPVVEPQVEPDDPPVVAIRLPRIRTRSS